MPDIRSFFGPKGGAAPPKPPAKVDTSKQKRTSKHNRSQLARLIATNTITEGRNVVEDSDDEDEIPAAWVEPTTSDSDTTNHKWHQQTYIKGAKEEDDVSYNNNDITYKHVLIIWI